MHVRGTHSLPAAITVFLLDVRSAHNAGAITRTAEAVGVSEIIFGGYTPGPVDRFGREHKAFTKASLGAQRYLSYRSVENCVAELLLLKQRGAFLLAVEQSPHALNYKHARLPTGTIVVVLGNEVTGLPDTILSLADLVVELPMQGRKESLNVSVAAGIILYHFFSP
jgi:tRNA G18 (ribose-2'-O)-methylase SpoU